MKWEYKTLTALNHRNSNSSLFGPSYTPMFPVSESELNQLGDDEWQLVAVVPIADLNGETEFVEYIFKRFK